MSATGLGSIVDGTTSDVITHGANFTPSLGEITITGGEDPQLDISTIWVDTITATQFTVHSEADPGNTDFDFGWSVNRTISSKPTATVVASAQINQDIVLFNKGVDYTQGGSASKLRVRVRIRIYNNLQF